ncbi:MAG: hypothetical protein ACLFVQ_03155 [Chitinispirillaceae bacterium]
MGKLIAEMNRGDQLIYGKTSLVRHKHERLKYRLLTFLEQRLLGGGRSAGLRITLSYDVCSVQKVKGMVIRVVSLGFVFLLILCQGTVADTLRLSSASVFPGVYYTQSHRDGYRLFDGFDWVQYLERETLSAFGLVAGRRFPLRWSGFRIQAAGELGLGTVAEDTIEGVQLSDNEFYSIIRYSSYYTAGVIADLHYTVPLGESALFFSAGPGIHGTYLHESEVTLDRQYSIEDDQLVDAVSFSLSMNFGVGVEFKLFGRYGGALVYGFRLWEPVRYIEVRDLFPMGAEYWESHMSHRVGIELLGGS